MKTLASLAWFSGACALAFAQTNSHQPAPAQGEWRLPGTESFVIRSSIVQRDYEIMVALPRKYSSSAKHPVLYVLDGNGAFPIAVEMMRFLSFDPSMKEEPIIVGIGYPVGRYWNTLPHRTRDFTPTANPGLLAGWGETYEFTPDGSGGAAKFLQALATEIIPRVESRYHIDDRRRALYGYSLGGLFAFYVLLQRPELFQFYLIGAPALVYDESAAWKTEEQFSESGRDLPARVFLMVGLLDKRMLPGVEKLDAVFRARKYRNFAWRTEFFPGETHDSAMSLCLSRGIRWLYGDLKTPDASAAEPNMAGDRPARTMGVSARKEMAGATVVPEVTEKMQAYIAALRRLDFERAIGQYLNDPQFRTYFDGQESGYADFVVAVRESLKQVRHFEGNVEGLVVTPLAPDAALASYRFVRTLTNSAGQASRHRGTTTWVWVKRDGEWRIIHGDAVHIPVP